MEKYNKIDYIENHKIYLPGSYGNKKIGIEIFPLISNKNVIINIHGTYGSAYGSNNKYLDFAKGLQEKKIGNAVLYESSRNEILEKNNLIKNNFEEKQKKFIGKTFYDELEDCKKVIYYCIENSQKLFGIDKKEVEITLNGNSLGGILAVFAGINFHQVKLISTIGTGAYINLGNIPILDTFPKIEEIKEKLKLYNGKIIMQYGTHDNIFTKDSFSLFYQNMKDKNKSYLEYLGVDHKFSLLYGKISKKPYLNILNVLYNILIEGKKIGGTVSLDTEETINKYNNDLSKIYTLSNSLNPKIIGKKQEEDIIFNHLY